jgi:hypothetical protein
MNLETSLRLTRFALLASFVTGTATDVVSDLHGMSWRLLTYPSLTMLTLCHLSFENRDACEDVIKTFNNRTIPTATEELQVQIRYADTQEQKSLKQQTQAARQFRSAEYEYATQAWRQGRLLYAGTTLNDNASTKGNEFEQYLGNNAAVPFQNQRWAQSAVRHAPGRSPLGAVPFTNAQTQTQSTQGDVTSATDANSSPRDDSAVDTKPLATSPATAHANSPVATSTVAPDQE